MTTLRATIKTNDIQDLMDLLKVVEFIKFLSVRIFLWQSQGPPIIMNLIHILISQIE